MIGLALKLLRDELSHYVFQNKRPTDSIQEDDIILHNIALMEGENQGDLDNKIVITLVNTEEESTLKNKGHSIKTLNGIQYKEPPVFLNLYILISATMGQDLQDAYEFALHRLSLIIQFFQAKKHFTVKNSPFTTISGDNSILQEIKSDIKLNVELYTLTFEQINHLWGSLGGKQVPFAMYKVRLVKIQEDTKIEAPVIEEIKTTEQIINNEC
ncbi:DUF4255 domain-containing protein [Galbibacter sp. EGI 63066]|uniref:DUF4255 domain-containing protein n=1 Tax=Galbibacter sp. EGI 63066 TaxID=2993559 RepID=UPI0022493B25|nr:DUF4255 domain-containing protein [Galbibacter sp. EGI 63066]MCX2680313.1 DUF4255 domain-containing protein [Galbibacter sp. EGI 63066]